MQKKEYKELLFTGDFLFCKILTNNLNLLKDLLEMIYLPMSGYNL